MIVNQKLKDTIVTSVRIGGDVLRSYFGRSIKISHKKDRSLVTITDRESERKIINYIKQNFPSHSIIAEERGFKSGDEYSWIIDPLDGTTNFSCHNPFFAVSIALIYKKEILLGATYSPLTDELFFAEKDRGFYLNGKKVVVKKGNKLSDALVLFNRGGKIDNYLSTCRAMTKVGQRCRTVRYWGSTSLELAYLATGRIDGYVNFGSKIWDFAAGVLMVKEAGGVTLNGRGRTWRLDDDSMIAANSNLCRQLIKIINT
ncbi:MAG: inositol monophosphatase family protein [bacterium]